MTKSQRWVEFQRLLREIFRADPHYPRIMDDSLRAWRPPSECTPLPPIPLKVTCREMQLDPRTVCGGSIERVARQMRFGGK